MIRPEVTESVRERERYPEPAPIRAGRTIKVCGHLVEEYEFKGTFYVYVDGFSCREGYEEAIQIIAKHKGLK